MKVLRRLKQINVIRSAIPLIEGLDRLIVSTSIRRASHRATRQLEAVGTVAARKILCALEDFRSEPSSPDAEHIDQIERERLRLSLDSSRLDDGTLPATGPYDTGVTISEACAVSKPHKPATLLYLLIRAFEPKSVLELGTNVGISSSFIGMALRHGSGGKLITMEASPYRLRHARKVHSNLGLDNIDYIEGLFADTLESTLQGASAIDFAFIDGHHQLQPTLDYFNAIARSSAPGAVFIFDDIRWSDDMRQAWNILQRDERFSLVMDFSSMGICVLRESGGSRRVVIRRLRAW